MQRLWCVRWMPQTTLLLLKIASCPIARHGVSRIISIEEKRRSSRLQLSLPLVVGGGDASCCSSQATRLVKIANGALVATRRPNWELISSG